MLHFLDQQGESLRRFATFLALSEYWQAQGKVYLTWQEWPSAYHDPAGPAVAEFAQSHERQLLCHMYAQWLLAGQIQETQSEARTRNLSLGLYLDLAVGVNPGGFDTWANQDLFALGIDIGAPPDDFSPLGQNWCLAPLLPQQLRAQGYRYFIQMLRQNCPIGGALRIDHVMGLFRLYWIPTGRQPGPGSLYPLSSRGNAENFGPGERQATDHSHWRGPGHCGPLYPGTTHRIPGAVHSPVLF